MRHNHCMKSLPPATDLIGELVAIPSVSSPDVRFDQSNRGVIDRLAEWAEHLRFRCEIQPLPQDPNKANLIATLGDGPGGLVLSGHTDTVPFDEASWSTDPFELVAKGERLYGLGSADMKGFFGAALHAASRFDPKTLKEPIVLVATADEESTMLGARVLVETKRPTATRAIVGEPTGLAPVRMHKGILIESLRIDGRSGHSSDPSLGHSALEAMHSVIAELLALRGELQAAHSNDAFKVPVPTMNLGRIEGGDSPNRICASCSLTFDLRPLPSMPLEATRKSVRDRIDALLADTPFVVHWDALMHGVPPFETPADAELVKAAEALSGQASRAVMFCTEGPYLAELGMETIICGAGSIDVAHQPDEYTDVPGVEAATELYAQLIHRFCVAQP